MGSSILLASDFLDSIDCRADISCTGLLARMRPICASSESLASKFQGGISYESAFHGGGCLLVGKRLCQQQNALWPRLQQAILSHHTLANGIATQYSERPQHLRPKYAAEEGEWPRDVPKLWRTRLWLVCSRGGCGKPTCQRIPRVSFVQPRPIQRPGGVSVLHRTRPARLLTKQSAATRTVLS